MKKKIKDKVFPKKKTCTLKKENCQNAKAIEPSFLSSENKKLNKKIETLESENKTLREILFSLEIYASKKELEAKKALCELKEAEKWILYFAKQKNTF